MYTVSVIKAPAAVVTPTPVTPVTPTPVTPVVTPPVTPVVTPVVTPTVEVLTGNGTTYRGAQNKTISGKTCQHWSVQVPHMHRDTPARYPTAGLTENYCRNPDGDATIWCYTNETTTLWETCVPIPAPVVVIPETLTGDGADYRGAQTKTRSGLECQKWLNQAPHMHKATVLRYPNSGLFDVGFENACRNPDGDATIWCYTMSPTKLWEACDPLTN